MMCTIMQAVCELPIIAYVEANAAFGEVHAIVWLIYSCAGL
jgi:hypothetical protein